MVLFLFGWKVPPTAPMNPAYRCFCGLFLLVGYVEILRWGQAVGLGAAACSEIFSPIFTRLAVWSASRNLDAVSHGAGNSKRIVAPSP